MPSLRIKRGTRAALNALAAANGLLAGEEYLITDENRVAVATSISTYQAYAKQGEGGGASILPVTVTLPNARGVFEHEEAVAVPGVTVGQRVMVSLAASDDTDENDPALLDCLSLAGRAGADVVTLHLAFGQLTAGPVKLNIQVA
jgi:hypothetical protein